MMTEFCQICRRELDRPDDEMSMDCGGHCLACIKDAEQGFAAEDAAVETVCASEGRTGEGR